MVKGFKKDGKFRPTEKRNKSSLSKEDMKKRTRVKDWHGNTGTVVHGKIVSDRDLIDSLERSKTSLNKSEKSLAEKYEFELKEDFKREKNEHDGIFQDGELLDMNFDDWLENELYTVENVIDDKDWEPYINKLNKTIEYRNSKNSDA